MTGFQMGQRSAADFIKLNFYKSIDDEKYFTKQTIKELYDKLEKEKDNGDEESI